VRFQHGMNTFIKECYWRRKTRRSSW